MKQWTVIAVTRGSVVWSEKFDHATAADLAATFVRNACGDDVHVTIIEPCYGE